MMRNFHSTCILLQILVNLFLDPNRLACHKIHKLRICSLYFAAGLECSLIREYQNCSEQMDVRKIHNTGTEIHSSS
jgi:hypothetical protein